MELLTFWNSFILPNISIVLSCLHAFPYVSCGLTFQHKMMLYHRIFRPVCCSPVGTAVHPGDYVHIWFDCPRTSPVIFAMQYSTREEICLTVDVNGKNDASFLISVEGIKSCINDRNSALRAE